MCPAIRKGEILESRSWLILMILDLMNYCTKVHLSQNFINNPSITFFVILLITLTQKE